jgi:hypothetical protein
VRARHMRLDLDGVSGCMLLFNAVSDQSASKGSTGSSAHGTLGSGEGEVKVRHKTSESVGVSGCMLLFNAVSSLECHGSVRRQQRTWQRMQG